MQIRSFRSLEEALNETFGGDVNIPADLAFADSRFNSTRVLFSGDGKKIFLKLSAAYNSSVFDAEEEGINAISDTKTIAVPKLYCKGTDENKGISFLMMELIEQGPETEDSLRQMGIEFANMHLADAKSFVAGGRYGFTGDNFIGASKQINTPADSWIDFYRDCRLMPQIRMAEKSLGPDNMRSAMKLLEKLDLYLREPKSPSLIHGDMWGGNYIIDKRGRAFLIDPAAYVGNAEADIAMTYMFSPMPRAFYEGYREMIPEEEGFRDRVDLYNLYHILNHHNLFGGYYLNAAIKIIRHYAG